MAEPVQAKIYDQDGNLVPFIMPDSQFAHQFREWLAGHDRHPRPRPFDERKDER